MRPLLRRFVAVLVCLIACSTASVATEYRIQDLSSFLPAYADVKDINSSGVIVGDGLFSTDTHAFYWSESTGSVDLGAFAGVGRSYARAINAAGIVVGFGDVPTLIDGVERTATHPLLWSLDGSVTDLGLPAGAIAAIAEDINDNGEILGVVVCSPIRPPPGAPPVDNVHVVVWNQEGDVVREVAAYPLSSNWGITHINDCGDILGSNLGATGFDHWVRHTDGSVAYLDKMGGDYISADALNDGGLVAGSLDHTDYSCLATVWNADGSVKSQFAPLTGDDFTCAYDINNSGVVVGESSNLESDSIRAVLWGPDGTQVGLGSLPGFEKSRARMISDSGWIVGECDTYGDERLALWTPIPEPASLLALVFGTATLAVRKKAAATR